MVVDVNPVYYDVPWAHLVDAIDAQFNQLETAGTHLTQAVNGRVAEYHQRVTDIRRRLEVARNKIDQIAKAKQGIVIYSPGSYPVPLDRQKESFKRLFPKKPVVCASAYDNTHRPLTSGHTKLKEGLQFLDVSLRSEDSDILRPIPRGMGQLRKRNIRSVADLLVFNTTINPYSEDSHLEENSVENVPSSQPIIGDFAEDDSEAKHADSSLTLPTLKDLSQIDGDSLEYHPGTSSTPELLFPSDLPLLDAFVTDLPDLLPSSAGNRSRSSAPADLPPLPANDSDGLLQLPDISDAGLGNGNDNSTLPPLSPPVATTLSAPSALPVPNAPIPPPPPPPPPPSTPATVSPEELRPPPPPPPPSSASSPSTSAPSARPAAPAGDRSSLLEAIRNHGGLSGLKTAQKGGPKRAAPKKPPAGAAAPALTHMEALVERLNKRRRDIAGGGPKQDSQAEAVSPPEQSSSGERPELVRGLMDKIVTQSKDDSDTDSDHKDDDCWSD